MADDEHQGGGSRGCGGLGCLLLIGLLLAVGAGGLYLSDALDPLYDRFLRQPHEVVELYVEAYEQEDEARARRFLCSAIRDGRLLDPSTPLGGRQRGLGGGIDEFPYPRSGGRVAIYYTLDANGPSAQALLEREDAGWRICALEPG